MFVIRIVGLPSGEPTPYDGKYLKRYNPNIPGHDPNGVPMLATVEADANLELAMRFAFINDALDYYYLVPDAPYDKREDGKPNRPLTAFTIQMIGLTEDGRIDTTSPVDHEPGMKPAVPTIEF